MQQGSARPSSIIVDTGVYTGDCGYCKGRDSSTSHGMVAKFMTPEAYQDLIDLGWRRSGTYLYKPDLKKTCCPQYTIRLCANEFQPSKSQAKLLKKWQNCAEKGSIPGVSANTKQQQQHNGPTKKMKQQQRQQQQASQLSSTLSGLLQEAVEALVQQGLLPEAVSYPPMMVLPAKPKVQQRQQQQQQHSQLGMEGCRLQASPAGFHGQDGRDMQIMQAHHTRRFQASAQPVPSQSSSSSNTPTDLVLCYHSPSAFAVSAAAARAAGVLLWRPAREGVGCALLDVAAAPPLSLPAAPPSAAAGTRAPGAGQQHPCCPAADPAWLAAQLVRRVAAVPGRAGKAPGEACPAAQVELPGGGLMLELRAEGAGHLNWYAPAGLAVPARAAGSAPVEHTRQFKEHQRTRAAPTQPLPLPLPLPPQQQHQQDLRGLHAAAEQAGVDAGSGVVITIAPSRFDEEEFALYQRYQVEQHQDDIKKLTRKSYCRFLVDSPLPAPQPTPAATSSSSNAGGSSVPTFCGFGSFHMQYRINGRLMAVGVVDVLPRCLSSVYLFWDSAFARLAPGKLSALKEIEWVQQASKIVPDLQHYYMGFYIHTCPKMRYKADYRPSDLLCPESKVWVRITPGVLRSLDAQRYVALSQLPNAHCAWNSAPVGLAAQREAPSLAEQGFKAAVVPAHLQPPQTDEEARRQQILQEVQRRKARQLALSSAANGIKAVVFDAVWSWEALKRTGMVIPKEQAGGVQRILEAWLELVGGVADQLGYELA